MSMREKRKPFPSATCMPSSSATLYGKPSRHSRKYANALYFPNFRLSPGMRCSMRPHETRRLGMSPGMRPPASVYRTGSSAFGSSDAFERALGVHDMEPNQSYFSLSCLVNANSIESYASHLAFRKSYTVTPAFWGSAVHEG